MTDLVQEFCDSRGIALRVDRQAGVIRGIKILGPHSRNGRDYLPGALSRAVGMYEGVKVNVNHPKGHPLTPRDYQERIGVIRNVQHRAGDGLFADFHFNPKHTLSEQLMWDAEHAPENVGFSHNVQARTRRQGENTLVEEIVQVHSVDLVADPATTRGLFEQYPAADGSRESATHTPSNGETTATENAASDELSTTTSLPTSNATESLACAQNSESLEQRCQEQAEEITVLRAELDRWRAVTVAQQTARRGPVSRDQVIDHVAEVSDGKSFARAITR
jgi:hypothetical protein